MITEASKINGVSSHTGIAARLVNGILIEGTATNVTETIHDMVILPDFSIPKDVDQQAQKQALDDYILQSEITTDEYAALISGYPQWKAGVEYEIDEWVSYNGSLYRVVQAHTSQANWHPDVVPALFTAVVPAGVIPVWVQPTGAQDAYAKDAKVEYNGHIYQSLIPANVTVPDGDEPYNRYWKLIS